MALKLSIFADFHRNHQNDRFSPLERWAAPASKIATESGKMDQNCSTKVPTLSKTPPASIPNMFEAVQCTWGVCSSQSAFFSKISLRLTASGLLGTFWLKIDFFEGRFQNRFGIRKKPFKRPRIRFQIKKKKTFWVLLHA